MSQDYSNRPGSAVASEIDAIIARAMAEYRAARGVESEVADTYAVNIDNPIAADTYSVNIDTAAPQSNSETSVSALPLDEDVQTIQENSNSILVEESTSRFSSATWFENIQSKDITLAGLGGIGSYVAFLLARLQPERIIIYDDDRVERGNLSGQLYDDASIGLSKARATERPAENFSGYFGIFAEDSRFTDQSPATDIMICGFDNMEARRTFFNSWKNHVANVGEKAKCLFIDGRLAAESLQVLCIKGDDEYNINRYEQEFLFADYEAEETICSYKQTSFMANMIGSIIVNLFVNFCANECNPLIPRDLPFFTEYTAETMYFKVIS
jgi:hypothetical protein